jgi:hypothetical protein
MTPEDRSSDTSQSLHEETLWAHVNTRIPGNRRNKTLYPNIALRFDTGLADNCCHASLLS